MENKIEQQNEPALRHKYLFDSIAQGVVYQDHTGTIIEANEAALQILGLTYDQLCGKTSYDPNWKAIHEDGSAYLGETHPSILALKTGVAVKNHVMGVFNPAKSHYKWIKINAYPLFHDRALKPHLVLSTFDDITESKITTLQLKESEEKFRNFFENSVVGKSITNIDGILTVNKRFCEIVGYTTEELNTLNWKDITHPDDIANAEKMITSLISGKEHMANWEKRFIHKDGRIVWVDISTTIQRDASKNPLYFITAIYDITERKFAEEKLRQSEEIFFKIFKNSPDAIILSRATDGAVIDVNDAALHITGYTLEEFKEQENTLLNIWESIDDHNHYDQTIQREGKIIDFEADFIIKSGELRTCRISGELIKIENDDYILCILNDITNLRKAESELIRQSKFVNTLIANQPSGVVACDETGDLVLFSKIAKEWHGIDVLKVPQEKWSEYFNLYNKDGIRLLQTHEIPLVKAFHEETVVNNEIIIKARGQKPRLVSCNGAAIFDNSGVKIGAVIVMNDITEQKNKEDKLIASEQQFRAIVEGAPYPIFIQTNKCFTYLNKHAVKLFGAKDEKELIGTPVLDRFHPDFHQKALDRIKQLNTDKKLVHEPFEQILLQCNGNEVWVETKGAPIFYNGEHGGMVFVSDMTYRKNAEEELRESKVLLENINNNLPGVIIKYKLFPNGNDALLYVSNGAKEIWGLDPKEAIEDNKKIWEQIDNEYIEQVRKSIEVSYTTLQPWYVEFKNKLPNGSYKWIEGIGIPKKYDDGSVIWDSILLDITSRKIAEAKMNQYKESLQALTTEISLVEEKQRKQIAANIHDHLSQSLVISKMKLREIINNNELPYNTYEISSVIKHLSDAIENSRKITYDLSPPVLYELGLIETMYWFTEKIQKDHGLKVTFETNQDHIKLSERKLILIFRAIQELTTNIIKHANATNVGIVFTILKDSFEILISDDGIGFDFSRALTIGNNNSGFGLFSVKERIQNLSGTINFESEIGKGTRVKIVFPLANE